VGPGDNQGPVLVEEEAGQSLWHGQPRHSQALGLDRLRVVTRNGVSDHDQIGSWLEMAGIEALEGFDSRVLQQGAHRWVDGPVGAPDPMALGFEQTGQRCHPRATDGDQVDVERSVSRGRQRGGVGFDCRGDGVQ
jgi:hypothetical protein